MRKVIRPDLSIVIATLNSGRILSKVLESLNKQSYPKSKCEILLIDGGSTDNTLQIATKYGCRIIHNPKTLPAWGKFLGYKNAKGKYAMFLDSDEMILDSRSIERKMNAFKTNGKIHAVTGSGYRQPENYSFINQYVCDFGDPFSYFYYRHTRDSRFFIESIIKEYSKIYESKDMVVIDFSSDINLPIFELVAMGSMIDLEYCKKNFPDIMDNPDTIPHIFNLLISKNTYIAIIKNDVLEHYSSASLRTYLGKLSSRVVNNIYSSSKEGFKGRVGNTKVLNIRKYLFLPYALSILFPFIDALHLAYSRRNIGYLLHVPLCFYTATLIIYYTVMKSLGIAPIMKSYGQLKQI